MNTNGDISVTQALNQIQSWLNAGEFEKVIQGCHEILGIEPGNPRALSLLKQAQERRHQTEVTPVSEPEPAPVEEPEMPMADPLASLEVEEAPTPVTPNEPSFEKEGFTKREKRSLFMAMLIPAILVVLIGGGIIWMVSNQNRDAVIEDAIVREVDRDYLKENETRVTELTQMGIVLETYKIKNGVYPSQTQVNKVLEQSEQFDSVPKDPRQGQLDKSGKAYGYVYAVYDSAEGENTDYIVSGLFEDSKGFAHPWSKGGSTKAHPNYRDTSQPKIGFIK
jgi:hypothetical protein